mmetsp:Transcript_19782/g.32433  ORF Transcript_19782/g.32433 Transcript_19782/m.32433 type:complete len:295 (+) Transcript_19782:115-999(+)
MSRYVDNRNDRTKRDRDWDDHDDRSNSRRRSEADERRNRDFKSVEDRRRSEPKSRDLRDRLGSEPERRDRERNGRRYDERSDRESKRSGFDLDGRLGPASEIHVDSKIDGNGISSDLRQSVDRAAAARRSMPRGFGLANGPTLKQRTVSDQELSVPRGRSYFEHDDREGERPGGGGRGRGRPGIDTWRREAFSRWSHDKWEEEQKLSEEEKKKPEESPAAKLPLAEEQPLPEEQNLLMTDATDAQKEVESEEVDKVDNIEDSGTKDEEPSLLQADTEEDPEISIDNPEMPDVAT